jgi:hypothetical protein
MSDAWLGAIAVVVGAIIGGVATSLSQREPQLMAECRSAIKDLKRFRQPEDKWSAESETHRLLII